jgi:hypothetical protein
MEEFFSGYFTGSMLQYTIPASFLKVNNVIKSKVTVFLKNSCVDKKKVKLSL